MFGFIKKIFLGLSIDLVNASNHAKCVFLTNQKCTTQPTLINLHPNEYSEGLSYYPFAISLDRLSEVVILLVTCLIKYVFQTRQKI